MGTDTPADVRVVPRNLRWEVEVHGITRRMIDWLCTKDRAIDHALERAAELIRGEPHGRAVVEVVRSDGSVEDRIVVIP